MQLSYFIMISEFLIMFICCLFIKYHLFEPSNKVSPTVYLGSVYLEKNKNAN